MDEWKESDNQINGEECFSICFEKWKEMGWKSHQKETTKSLEERNDFIIKAIPMFQD